MKPGKPWSSTGSSVDLAMTQASRVNLGLLLLALLLVGFVVNDITEPPIVVEPISQLSAATLTQIQLLRPKQKNVALSRANHDAPWIMQQPFQAEADGARIARLLGLLEKTPGTRYPLAGLDLPELGLTDDSERMLIRTAQGQQETLVFGRSNPLNGLRYIRNGDWVYLLADVTFYLLRSAATDYVSPYLLPQGSKIKRLRLPDLTLRRSASGWVSESSSGPPLANTSADAEQILIDRWQSASALQVLQSSDTQGAAMMPVFIELVDGQTLSFEAWTTPSGVELQRPELGLSWHVQLDQWQKMIRP